MQAFLSVKQIHCRRVDIREKSSNNLTASRADAGLQKVMGVMRHDCQSVVWKTEELNMNIAARTLIFRKSSD
jgi:hypothetical protein